MAYLIPKLLLVAIVLSVVYAQTPANDQYGKYQDQSCCPAGYFEAGQYCVKCNEPKHWNPVAQKCVVCEPGFIWNT